MIKCPSCGHMNVAGADECESCLESLTDIPALVHKKGMERRILEGTVADLKPKTAVSIRPGESALAAVEAMRRDKVGCVFVVDGQELVGILSERELLLRASDKNLKATAVRDVMRTHPTCLLEDDQVAEAFHRMAMSGHRHVPIRLKRGSYGVVSARDLLRYLCK